VSILLMQTPVPDIPLPPVVIQQPPWETLPPQVFLLMVLAIVAGTTIIFWPLMRAIARRIEGRGRESTALREEIEQLRARLAEVDAVQGRLGELEERLDFAERMLAQRTEPDRLQRG